ncbi:acyltransferase [Chitinophaga sp. CC14]|uniref:acyltransferase n=1 Tax=Chitinophaga sp. CC14 TaxID=3029199 RepID=UPI003B8067F9
MRYLIRIIDLLKTVLYYKFVFKRIGIKSIIGKPLKIDGGNNIIIGESVYVAKGTWLAALPLTGEKECVLEIGDGSNIGHFNHIYATKKIVLERNVLTADKVYISDNLHDYENIHLPVMKQRIRQIGEVIIGEGSWLGENVCILGAKIGKNCVIGANAVVTKDIPDFSIVVGAPAYIIKRYCFETNSWRKTDNKGFFI